MIDDIREWISDNLRYILLGLAVLLFLIIVICIVRITTGGSGETGEPNVQNDVQQVEETTEAAQDPEEAEEAEDAQTAEGSNAPAETGSDLVKDDGPILALMKEYYTAVAAKDVTTLSGIVSPWNEDVQKEILSDTVVESYNNISTYSKAGKDEGSYVVFVYFEGKVEDIDTLVPSLARQYVITDESGKLVTCSEWDDSITDYVNTVSASSDVQALIADIQKLYDKALASDEALNEYMGGVEAAENENSSDTGERKMSVTANTGLNIRQQPNAESAIMGSVNNGQIVTVLEDAGNGWVHINYDSQAGVIDGYVMLQYLAETAQ